MKPLHFVVPIKNIIIIGKLGSNFSFMFLTELSLLLVTEQIGGVLILLLIQTPTETILTLRTIMILYRVLLLRFTRVIVFNFHCANAQNDEAIT